MVDKYLVTCRSETQVIGLRVQTPNWGLKGDFTGEAMPVVGPKDAHFQGSELCREGTQRLAH